MNLRVSLSWIIGLMLVTIAVASADELSGPFRITDAEIKGLVSDTTNGLAASLLPTGSQGPVAVAVRREKSGEVEMHESFHDIFIAQSGRASVLVGGETEGQSQTKPSEWLGGTISEAETYEFEPGDVIWIPAGIPHQMIVPKGGTINYLAFKYPK